MTFALQTARLRLEACSAEFAQAACSDRRRAEGLCGLRLHPQWPEPDTLQALASYARVLRQVPRLRGFGIWTLAYEGEVVGDAGFKGPPRMGEIELGYGIVPALRGRGLATEAAAALCAWAISQGVRAIHARCEADNVSSLRVLSKLGMRACGGGRYVLEASVNPALHPAT
ncbi:N-acetyltransferase [bacterium]|nr:MAG: N-acetyltransferase [bacterium]